ncbi:MAG: DsbA family protein [Bryobacteraceae bacterium]|nr:DsbA family protein [Bryobacteraceae bacterium]
MRALPFLLTAFALAGLPLAAQTTKKAAPQKNHKANPTPPAAAKVKSALDKATMEAYVRHLFLWGPQIAVKVDDPVASQSLPGFQEVVVTGSAGAAQQQETFYVSKDGQTLLRGSVYDVKGSPFKNDLAKLKTDLQPSFGTPGAPVVIAIFSDFQCHYCKEEAKVLRENLLKAYPKEVRVYFKDFPIDQIHPWARAASIAGRCVFRQAPAAFWDYHDWIFENQTQVTVENLRQKVFDWAKTKNLDTLMLGQCVDNRATEGEINKNVEEARALKVDSTPTLFVNGRKIPGSLQWPQLKQVIDFELEHYKKTGEGGEKCCEVKLPTPFNQ